jgi:hypothetical protein
VQIPDPAPTEAALELAALARLVGEVPLPPADLPGWQSLTAAEYARAVRALAVLLAVAEAALAAARDAG